MSAHGSEDPGPFFHGTKADLKAGDLLDPGRRSNFGERRTANFVYLTDQKFPRVRDLSHQVGVRRQLCDRLAVLAQRLRPASLPGVSIEVVHGPDRGTSYDASPARCPRRPPSRFPQIGPRGLLRTHVRLTILV